jgi:hypothetical protein
MMNAPETIYGYTMRLGDRYAFHRGDLIVVHAHREPVAISPEGTMTLLPLWYPGEQDKLSMEIDKKRQR